MDNREEKAKGFSSELASSKMNAILKQLIEEKSEAKDDHLF